MLTQFLTLHPTITTLDISQGINTPRGFTNPTAQFLPILDTIAATVEQLAFIFALGIRKITRVILCEQKELSRSEFTSVRHLDVVLRTTSITRLEGIYWSDSFCMLWLYMGATFPSLQYLQALLRPCSLNSVDTPHPDQCGCFFDARDTFTGAFAELRILQLEYLPFHDAIRTLAPKWATEHIVPNAPMLEEISLSMPGARKMEEFWYWDRNESGLV